MSNSCRSGCGLGPISGRSLESVSENTETNCWFSMLALAFGLMWVIPLCLSGDMPDESHLLLLIKDQNLLGLSLKSSQKMSLMYLLYALRFSF